MKIAILSCGRSDYSIYLPLIKRMSIDNFFEMDIIAFGTHPYHNYGNTIKYFTKDGFNVKYIIRSLLQGSDPQAIAESIGLTTMKFSQIWSNEKYDLLFVLGDRYEMLAATLSSVPFNIPIAHLHGGETTLGAIDNKFRHAITIMSKYHFVSTENHAKKVKQIIGESNNIYNVGALSIDNISDLKLKSIKELSKILRVDFNQPVVLATLHPETINFDINSKLTDEFIKTIEKSRYQTILTLPNNDTYNELMREKLISFGEKNEKVHVFDSLGPLLYYSCMQYCYCVLGNSSSGIIEASSFHKYVINIGDRQKGRDRGKNVIDVGIDHKNIINTLKKINYLPELLDQNIYGDGTTSNKIIRILRSL